jgi:hypothetical protein
VGRIASAFKQVIPGDILQFAQSEQGAGEISFAVSYTIRASGALYFSAREQHLPEKQRHWYTGIVFDWRFQVGAPGEESLPLEFSFTSNPANEFYFTYSSSKSRAAEQPSARAVYDAMAESAFEEFTSKLLSALSVQDQPTTPPEPPPSTRKKARIPV